MIEEEDEEVQEPMVRELIVKASLPAISFDSADFRGHIFIAVWSAEDAGRRPSRTTSTWHDLPVVQDESEDQIN